MTALVDPESFLDLAEVVNAVGEQIIGSQRVIINKVDLASPETVRRVREKVQTLNPSAEILETSYAQVERFWNVRCVSHPQGCSFYGISKKLMEGRFIISSGRRRA